MKSKRIEIANMYINTKSLITFIQRADRNREHVHKHKSSIFDPECPDDMTLRDSVIWTMIMLILTFGFAMII